VFRSWPALSASLVFSLGQFLSASAEAAGLLAQEAQVVHLHAQQEHCFAAAMHQAFSCVVDPFPSVLDFDWSKVCCLHPCNTKASLGNFFSIKLLLFA
jgi:hypothetical protein